MNTCAFRKRFYTHLKSPQFKRVDCLNMEFGGFIPEHEMMWISCHPLPGWWWHHLSDPAGCRVSEAGETLCGGRFAPTDHHPSFPHRHPVGMRVRANLVWYLGTFIFLLQYLYWGVERLGTGFLGHILNTPPRNLQFYHSIAVWLDILFQLIKSQVS